MADKIIVSKSKVTALADSIREKTGVSDLLTFNEMKTAIDEFKGGGGVIEVEELPKVKWEGTAVPDSGNIGLVYLNLNLSTIEVFNILNSLNITNVPSFGLVYPIIANSDFTKFLVVGTSYEENEDGSFTINSFQITTETTLLFHSSYGWFVEEDNRLLINYENILSLAAPQVGVEIQNDKLSSILSITPFEGGEEAEEGSIYKDYDDDKYYLLKNKNFINLSTKLIESKTLPIITDNIEVPNNKHVYCVYFNTNLSINETVSILENLTYYNINGAKVNILLTSGSNMIAVSIDGSVCVISDIMNEYVFFINKKTEELNFVGWNPEFNGLYIINGVVTNNNPIFSLPSGTENSLISKLFSIKPFLEERYIEEGDIIKVPNTGTTIPNSGLVEKIYFNRNISEDEYYNLLNNSVTFIDASLVGSSGFSFYPVMAYLVDGNPYILTFFKYSENTIFLDLVNFGTNEIVNSFFENSWLFFKNPYTIGTELLSDLSGIPIGTENNLLSNLISITPFDNTMYIYENGKYVELVKNE